MECNYKAFAEGFNKKKFAGKGDHMVFDLRVKYRKTLKKKGERRRKCNHIEVACGCCNSRLVVTGGAICGEAELEIGGVLGTLEDWRKVLLPLLGVADEQAQANIQSNHGK